MKNWKNMVKKVVALMLLAGVLVTVPPCTGGEPGIMPCGGDPVIEHNPCI